MSFGILRGDLNEERGGAFVCFNTWAIGELALGIWVLK